MTRPIVYLAGPINGCTDAECIEWRQQVARGLCNSYTILDPMARDYRGREDDSATAIVEGDEADIRAADIVLVNALQGPTWGTAMEVRMAFRELGKTVVTITEGTRPVSPWLRYHSTFVVGSVAHAINHLRRAASERAA